ncbi:MAG: GlsB/YeaQ/YmgE family stress response membrane protein [Haliscomenobacter sp.]|nr:GlsB/YeaQ/YmgE family stress response membrane protein [Haliscomenobacter sp.]MBK8878593.1 GlsB/YeaQ/YmgE family stress response membrane protein [Haliscomenobacter sp.]
MEIILHLLVGAAAGWLGGQVMQGSGFGILGNIVVGLIGGLIGGYLFAFLGIQTNGGLTGSIITAAVGAIVLLWIARMVKGPARSRRR